MQESVMGELSQELSKANNIHISRAINLAIWLYKKLLYLFYFLNLLNTQH